MSQASLNKKDTTFLNKHPIGHVTFYYGNEVPEGYMVCKGQILDVDTNPEFLELYNKIGNTYGGDSHKNFRLPNFTVKGSRKVNAAIIKYFQPVNVNNGITDLTCKLNSQLIKCECGSDFIGSLNHSNWCPKG